VPQHEHGAMLRPQPAKAAIERVAILDAARGVRVIRDLRDHDHARGAASFAARLAIHAADQHATQPGVEAVEVAQPPQVAPGQDEGLLDRIVGEIAVAEHELGDVEQSADRFGGEARERFAIASACLLDQVSSHGPPLVAGSMRRFRTIGTRAGLFVPSSPKVRNGEANEPAHIPVRSSKRGGRVLAFLYAHDVSEPVKQSVARGLLETLWANRTGTLSTQILQEFYVVATGKFTPPMSAVQAREIVGLYGTWQHVQVDLSLILAATELEERHSLSFWDALALEATCRAGATRLVTEDMQGGRIIAGVRIENPFA